MWNYIINCVIFRVEQRMFSYDLSFKREGKLPAVSQWINPRYFGPGDLLLRQAHAVPTEAKVNNPLEWRKDFPDYAYVFPEMQELKKKLNSAKHMLDPIRANPVNEKKYEEISNLTRLHEDLRGKHGVLVQNYGAEIVTNAWLKMYETMPFLEPLLEKQEKNSKDLHTFHIAEAPGNFILAINHYMKTMHSGLHWEWLANSYRDVGTVVREDAPSHYLEDQYGLMANYPDRWMYGADGDGDITSTANIRSFAQDIKSKFDGELQFITSDVKYVPVDVNYDEEEMINIPVHLGHLLCALHTLSPGGIMLLKEFTFFEAPSVSLLYIMACVFDKLLVIKPETSKPANSEVYILGIGFRKPLTELQAERLFNIMTYIRSLNIADGSPSIFRKKDIPEAFYKKVLELSQKLAEMQIEQLHKSVENYKKYIHTPVNRILRDVSSARNKFATKWIEQLGVRPLDRSYYLARGAFKRSANFSAKRENLPLDAGKV